MKKLIINADDFGLAPGVNRGIIDAAKDGIVTSTSVMVTAPYVTQAVDLLAQANVSMGMGLHIVLNGDLPTFSKSPRFTSPTGYLPLPEWDASDEDDFLTEMRYEIRSQFETFIRLTGMKPDHLDSHHNICFKQPLLKRITFELLSDYQIPIRDPSKNDWLNHAIDGEPDDPLSAELRAAKVKVARTLRDFRGDGATFETLSHILRNIPETGIYELMCHAGYVDDALNSSYNTHRQVELDILRMPAVKTIIESEHIHLTTYAAAYTLPPRKMSV